ncbi:AAA family ATPase [Metallibacterium sp.]|uniref:ATP-binding protein n=1 Tax=Metallibacterium sp. TaxID=2940281 RepID=UPI00261F7A62|nr:AAA family ATPase [Metallibacterium sp.]
MLLERDDSLRALAEQAARAARGNGGTVLLAGEAGIGKTTLLRAFAAQQVAPCRMFWGCCEPLSTARPLGPLQDMAALLDDELAALLDAGAPPPRIFARVLDSLQHASAPSVLIFEDVHWADATTLDLIRYLGRRLPALSTLLILSLRSDEVAPDHPLARLPGDLPAAALSHIKLAPLSAAAVAMLAQRVGRDGDALYRVTAGNPFFVTEVLAESGVTGADLPVTVRDAVWARLARLDDSECALLELLSVIPGWAEAGLWRALDPAEIDALERCLARGILQRGADDAIAYRHEMARLAVLERLGSVRQQVLHARIVTLLESRVGGDVPLARLVHHAAAAGDIARVLHLAPRAATEAARLGAHQQAAQQLELALRYVRQASAEQAAQLYQDWAIETAFALGVDDEVLQAHRHAITIFRRIGRMDAVSTNLQRLARVHWYRGEADEARRCADAAIEAVADPSEDPIKAMALAVRAQLHLLQEEFAEAMTLAECALACAPRDDALTARVHALITLDTAALQSGCNAPAACTQLEQTLQLALRHDLHEHAVRAYGNLAEHALATRQLERAGRILQAALGYGRRIEAGTWMHYQTGLLAQVRAAQGRHGEAQLLARGVLHQSVPGLAAALPAHLAMARVASRTNPVEAIADLSRLLARLDQVYSPPRLQALLHLVLLEAAWLNGDRDLARQQAERLQSAKTLFFNPWNQGEIAAWCRRLEISAQVGDVDMLPEPWAMELRGDGVAAADAWLELGMPAEAALALLQVRGSGSAEALRRAVQIADSIDAAAIGRRGRALAHELGVAGTLPRSRRGHYGVARSHPLGLTARELQVLRLLAEGHGSAAISRHLSRSPRTIEHHIASVYAKLGLSNRIDLLLKLRDEPWLLQSEQAAGSFAPSRLRA